MFLFRRATSPYYAIFIMNRLDPENLMLMLDPEMEVVLLEEFVVYKLADGRQSFCLCISGGGFGMTGCIETTRNSPRTLDV